MSSRTMFIIISATLIVLIVFVYIFSVPPKGDRIGPPQKPDTAIITLDSASHAMSIEK